MKLSRILHSKPCLAVVFLFSFLMPAAWAQNISQVFAFACNGGSCPNGASPVALIQASDGNFYGLAPFTQIGTSAFHGGTVFKLTPSGTFTRLFVFPAGSKNNFPDGDGPSSVVEGKDGFLYGVSGGGGTHGEGTFFKISKTGTGFQVLHNFCSKTNCADSALPISIVLGPDGNFYGTSSEGGISTFGTSCSPSGCGTVFRLTSSRIFTLIHAFLGNTDGTKPSALIAALDGNLYGFVIPSNASALLFRVATTGHFTAVKPFTFTNINTVIQSGLAAASGILYGVGCHYLLHQHVLFELNLDGSNLQTLAPFESCDAGSFSASLLSASDGNVWVSSAPDPSALPAGITALSPKSGLPLKTFSFDGAIGSGPVGVLIQAKDGKLYGTTETGGTVSSGSPMGVVYSLDAGLPTFE